MITHRQITVNLSRFRNIYTEGKLGLSAFKVSREELNSKRVSRLVRGLGFPLVFNSTGIREPIMCLVKVTVTKGTCTKVLPLVTRRNHAA